MTLVVGENVPKEIRALVVYVIARAAERSSPRQLAQEFIPGIVDFCSALSFQDPKFLGVGHLFWPGFGPQAKGRIIASEVLSCSSRKEARSLAHEYAPVFPAWAISPYVITESIHYIPRWPGDDRPRLHSAYTVHGRFREELGFQHSDQVLACFGSRNFQSQILYPYKWQKNLESELLSWRPLITQFSPVPKVKHLFLVVPMDFATRTDLRDFLLTGKKLSKRMAAVMDVWHAGESQRLHPARRS
jgi:hypothetical protein